MKKITLSLTILSFFSMCTFAFSHPPTKIVINMGKKGKFLKATINHPVSDPRMHYIKKIVIKQNDKVIITDVMKKQDESKGLVVQYLLPDTKRGDIITFEAYCNITGKRVEEFEVEVEPENISIEGNLIKSPLF